MMKKENFTHPPSLIITEAMKIFPLQFQQHMNPLAIKEILWTFGDQLTEKDLMTTAVRVPQLFWCEKILVD